MSLKDLPLSPSGDGEDVITSGYVAELEGLRRCRNFSRS